MAHHTSHKSTLAAPGQGHHNPPPSMDPTFKKKTKPTTTKNPDPMIKSSFFVTNHLSRLDPSHKIYYPSQRKPSNSKYNNLAPPGVDIHLQAKAMTVSADSDSSKFFLLTKAKNFHEKVVPKVEKESKSTKEASKEKAKKSKKKEVQGLDMKKLSVRDKQGKDPNEGQDAKRGLDSLGVRGGRRRSFCGSQIELVDVLASCGVKVVSVDMPPFMQIHAVDCARKTYDSLEKFTSKALALTLKKEFDGVYGPAWHCIVGKSFGSFVTHSVGGFLYFSMDQKLHILLFKTTVQRAD